MFCRNGGVPWKRNDENNQDNEQENGRTKYTNGGVADGDGNRSQGS